MAISRRFLNQTHTLHELCQMAVIDNSSFDRVAVSSRYRPKTDYRILSLKKTILFDCKTGVILDVRCSTNKLPGTRISEQVLKRNLNTLNVIAANIGHD